MKLLKLWRWIITVYWPRTCTDHHAAAPFLPILQQFKVLLFTNEPASRTEGLAMFTGQSKLDRKMKNEEKKKKNIKIPSQVMPRLMHLPCAVKITMGWMVYHSSSCYLKPPPPPSAFRTAFFLCSILSPRCWKQSSDFGPYWFKGALLDWDLVSVEAAGAQWPHHVPETSFRWHELCDVVHCSARKLHQKMPYLKLRLVRPALSSRSPIVQLWRVCES